MSAVVENGGYAAPPTAAPRLETRAVLFTAALSARIDGKTVATGRAEIAAGGKA